jgi:hypothetical protein
MLTRCTCPQCDGRLVPLQRKINHQRTLLKNRTLTQQNARQRQHSEVTPNASNSGTSGTSNLTVDHHHRPTSNFEVPISHASLLAPIDPVHQRLDHPHVVDHPHVANYEDQQPLDGYYHDDQDFENNNEDTGVGPVTPVLLEPNEDDFDPFVVERENRQNDHSLDDIPGYLLVVYATVSWLHLQFYLPRVACNALLAIIACLLRFLDPHMAVPFVTLISATRSLGVDTHMELLAVCPNCRDVYPSAGSKHMQETCTTCNVQLFQPDLTNRGNRRSAKTPKIKYPYLSLSEQLKSLLMVPGVEALLDGWREKHRKPAHYSDIFDGKVCRLDLKAPDGSPFFSNLPHQKNGPDGELRIGVNLGVDWYVYVFVFTQNMTY